MWDHNQYSRTYIQINWNFKFLLVKYYKKKIENHINLSINIQSIWRSKINMFILENKSAEMGFKDNTHKRLTIAKRI